MHGRNMLKEYVKSIGKFEFTEPKISTIALIGQVFKTKYIDNTTQKLDLYEVCNSVELSLFPNLIYVEYKNDERKISKGKIDNIGKDDIEIKGFANSATFIVKLSGNQERKAIKSKLSTNGSLQLPGFKTEEEIEDFIKIFNNIMKGINIIPSDEVDVHITSISMIKYDLSLKNECVYLDSTRLANYLIDNVKEHKIFVSYEGMESKSVEMHWTNSKGESIECYPFWSFKINLTSVKSIESVHESYLHITNFLINNIENFIMLDNLTNLVHILKTYQCNHGQKTEEWDKQRRNSIGASEISSIFNMAFSTSRKQLIREKVKLRKTGQKSFFGNSATRHGEAFEPIAIQLYTRYWNATRAKNGSAPYCFSMQVSSILHNVYPFISASPDSLIFTTDEKIPYSENVTLEKLETLIKESKIYNFHTLEIKCPSNYKIYGEGQKSIKCIDGYVPSYYWCQMQQQMYVTGANSGVFMNNHFTEISEEEYDGLEDIKCYRGVFIRIFKDQNTKVPLTILYPKDCFAKKKDALLELQYPLLNYEEKGYIINTVYWHLREFTMTEVEFSDKWETEYVPKIIECEEEIKREMEEDFL